MSVQWEAWEIDLLRREPKPRVIPDTEPARWFWWLIAAIPCVCLGIVIWWLR